MTARVPDCHPDRKHRGHGLCALCYSRKWQKENTNSNRPMSYRKWELKKFYGLTPEGYQKLVDSCGGKCQLCDKEAKLHVDHDHVSGKVRGLLCLNCNMGLGHYERMLANPKLKDYLS